LSVSSFILCALTPFVAAGCIWWGLLMLSDTREVFGHPIPVPAPVFLPLGWAREWLTGVAMYAGPVCQLVAITTAVVWVRYRAHPLAVPIAVTAGVALLLAGVIASGVTVAFAAATNYSDRPGVVLTEIILATGVVVSVLSAAWWLLTYIGPGLHHRLVA
jgi:hypothetical protein